MQIAFDNSYSKLPKEFFQNIAPTPVEKPELIVWNHKLARGLGLSVDINESELVNQLSGNQAIDGARPIALAYAGHQFGHFVPRLGDGRAILLGEIISPGGERIDLQLKGSGPTLFSRRGDGRAALGPVLREYLLSEAMQAFNVPTTRALAAMLTGEFVLREQELRGAILLRTAASHIRIGTFEYFFAQNNLENLKILTNYTIDRHYPECQQSSNPNKMFLKQIIERQAVLLAQWMSLGFIHGVMNTDNMTVSGETIDYGPAAFIDSFDLNKVFSFIDEQGRYAYGSQPKIAIWNLQSLANCLAPLIPKESFPADGFENYVAEIFTEEFNYQWQKTIALKLGIENCTVSDGELINELFEVMQQSSLDFTLCFRYLSWIAGGSLTDQTLYHQFIADVKFQAWQQRWLQRLTEENIPKAEISKKMLQVNPAVIPRNHKVAEIIKAAEDLDFKPFHKFLSVLASPFEESSESAEYQLPPTKAQEVRYTFCGT